jgi:hypothetical protein
VVRILLTKPLRSFRAIYNHARRTCGLPESSTMAIEWFEGKPYGRIIENLKHWPKTISIRDGSDGRRSAGRGWTQECWKRL